jgi:hypothetical protein
MEFADAARRWTEHAFSLRSPGVGMAGYRSRNVGVDQIPYWKSDPSFLYGVAGIGLALLALVSPVTVRWDGALLTDLPRVRGGP